MSKFTVGFVVGAIGAGVWTLLNVTQDGTATRQQIKDYLGKVGEGAQAVATDAQHVNRAVTALTEQGVPLIQQTAKEIQTLFKHFQESNSPRIRRTQEKLVKLQHNIKENVESMNKA